MEISYFSSTQQSPGVSLDCVLSHLNVAASLQLGELGKLHQTGVLLLYFIPHLCKLVLQSHTGNMYI